MANRLLNKWSGFGGLAYSLLNTFGVEFLPFWLRVVGFGGGLAVFLLWITKEHFQWITKNSRANAFDAGVIILLEYAAIGLVLFILDAEFGLAPERLPTAREVATEQGGGDNFCYFKADFRRPKNGGYEWQLINKQGRLITPVRTCLYKGDEKNNDFLRCWKPEQSSYCHPDTIDMTTSTAKEKPIKPGQYYFKFSSMNNWEQTLDIRKTKDGLKQTIRIIRNGGVIWPKGAGHEPR